jgi:hypothetical protein
MSSEAMAEKWACLKGCIQYLFSEDFQLYCYHVYAQRLWLYLTLGILAVIIVLMGANHPIVLLLVALFCAALPVVVFRILKWRFSERPYPLGSVLTLFIAAQIIALQVMTAQQNEQLADWEKDSMVSTAASPTPSPSESASVNIPAQWFIASKEDHSRKAMTMALSEYGPGEVEQLPTDKKMTYTIVITSKLSNEQAKVVMDEAISKITTDDADIDELVVYAYSNKDEIVGQPPDIGQAIWGYEGKLGGMTPTIVTSNDRTNYSTTYELKHDDLLAYLESKTRQEVRHGLSQAKRMEIYRAIMQGSEKASHESEVWVSKHRSGDFNMVAYSRYSDKLFEKSENRIKKKYHISDDMMTKINSEGFEKHWPAGLGGQ